MALVGSRIRVWWTEEKAWYAGRVVSCKRGVHTVSYDDGASLKHDLLQETWETERALKRKTVAEANEPKKRAKKQPPAQEQAAAPPPPPTTSTHAYAVGQHVEAKYQAQRVGSIGAKWYAGVVRTVHGDGACDIDYDDGDREDKVPRKFLRLPPPTKVKAGAAAQEAPRAPQLQEAPAAAPQISEYEQQRLQRVAANRQKLADLDLLSARDSCRDAPKRFKPRAPSKPRVAAAPSRASRRLKGEVTEEPALRDSRRLLSADEFIVDDDDEHEVRSALRRASTRPTLTAEQRAKLDALASLSTPADVEPLSAEEVEALARVGSLSSGGWKEHGASTVWAAKRALLAEAREKHGLRWPEWLDAIEAALPGKWGSTVTARDNTLFGIEAAACGFGFPYKHWPEGVGVLLANEVGGAPSTPRLLTLGSDTEALRREGERLEARYARDAGNGWAYKHMCNKLRLYQELLLLEHFNEKPSGPSIREQEEGQDGLA